MLIDTHCHLDAAEFDGDRGAVLDEARRAGVGAFLVPAVGAANFDAVAALSTGNPDCRHAFGIHPMYVRGAQALVLMPVPRPAAQAAAKGADA